MRLAPRLYLIGLACIFATMGSLNPAAAAKFKHAPSAYEATELVREIGALSPSALGGDVLLRRGLKAMRENKARDAYNLLLLAAQARPTSAEVFAGLAEVALAVPPINASEKYKLETRATAAAYQAYQLASQEADRAHYLALLATTFERRQIWRPAIDALKASIDLDPVPTVVQRHTQLRAAHGFRIANYSVEADGATPRVCVQFFRTAGARAAGFLTVFLRQRSRSGGGAHGCLPGLRGRSGTRQAF